MTFCHKCGKRSGKEDLVCVNCGAHLRRRSKKTNYTPIVIRAILLIALVLFFMYLINKYWGT
ncbi:MAG: hypothetical protein AABW41_01165 [Nanoarchaeota archaeon]